MTSSHWLSSCHTPLTLTLTFCPCHPGQGSMWLIQTKKHLSVGFYIHNNLFYFMVPWGWRTCLCNFYENRQKYIFGCPRQIKFYFYFYIIIPKFPICSYCMSYCFVELEPKIFSQYSGKNPLLWALWHCSTSKYNIFSHEILKGTKGDFSGQIQNGSLYPRSKVNKPLTAFVDATCWCVCVIS